MNIYPEMSNLESKMGYEFEKGPKAKYMAFSTKYFTYIYSYMETHFQQTCTGKFWLWHKK